MRRGYKGFTYFTAVRSDRLGSRRMCTSASPSSFSIPRQATQDTSLELRSAWHDFNPETSERVARNSTKPGTRGRAHPGGPSRGLGFGRCSINLVPPRTTLASRESHPDQGAAHGADRGHPQNGIAARRLGVGGPPARALRPVHHRDVGTGELLRHAGAPGALSDQGDRH